MKKSAYYFMFSLFACFFLLSAELKAESYNHFYYVVLDDGTISITGYDNYSEKEIIIPSKINNKSVTKIGEGIFRDYNNLESVTISEGVTSIGDWAFQYCSNLTSVSIPNSVTNIGKYAFSNTPWIETQLKENNGLAIVKHILIEADKKINGDISIPIGVTSIGGSAFSGCSSLTSVSIPESVTNFGPYVFYYCRNLTSVNIPEGVTNIENGMFFNCNSLKSMTIPNSVTSIGDEAFFGCSNLESVNIPNGVARIGNSAFSGCSNLESVNIPNGVARIGKSAFSGCSNLESVTIPNGVTRIENLAFSGCSNLKSVTIPNSVISIGDLAFSGCSSLESVSIPESVTSIGERVFSGCSSLNNVSIPESLTNIGALAFKDTPWIRDQHNGFYIINHTLITFDKEGDVTIPDGVTNIGTNVFRYCSSITSINIPDGMISIGKNTFWGCSNLTSVTIPNSVTNIGSSAFVNCSSLKSVTIPNGVTRIEDSTFSGCSSLTSVTIPNSVTSIGDEAFDGCSSLESVTIPNSVTNIGSSAFRGCRSLKSVTIPESVTNIGNHAFCYSGLMTIDIPRNVTNINEGVFGCCDNLTNINIQEGTINIKSSAFYNCNSLTNIIIPKSIKYIHPEAFLKHNKLFKINCFNNSYAQKYAEETNLRYKIIDSNNIEYNNNTLKVGLACNSSSVKTGNYFDLYIIAAKDLSLDLDNIELFSSFSSPDLVKFLYKGEDASYTFKAKSPGEVTITLSDSTGMFFGSYSVIINENDNYIPLTGKIDKYDNQLSLGTKGRTFSIDFSDKLGYLYTAKFSFIQRLDSLDIYDIRLNDIINNVINKSIFVRETVDSSTGITTYAQSGIGVALTVLNKEGSEASDISLDIVPEVSEEEGTLNWGDDIPAQFSVMFSGTSGKFVSLINRQTPEDTTAIEADLWADCVKLSLGYTTGGAMNPFEDICIDFFNIMMTSNNGYSYIVTSIDEPIENLDHQIYLNVGDKIKFSSIAEISNDSDYSYKSSDDDKVKVNDVGTIKAVKSGKTSVFAWEKSKYKNENEAKEHGELIEYIVNVLDNIAISLEDTKLLVGSTTKFSVATTNSNSDIIWLVEDETIASISETNGINATVKGLKVGNTILTAVQMVNGIEKQASCKITVTDSNSGTDQIVQPTNHIFQDYKFEKAVSDGAIVIYGNGATAMKVGDKTINSKQAIIYTDILASNVYTEKSGKTKVATGKVVVGITKSAEKPILNKNKIVDKEAEKFAKATIRYGQITVKATGTKGGTVYLWVIDTGDAGASSYVPITVKLAPKKLEVHDTNDNKIIKAEVVKGDKVTVQIAAFSGATKIDDATYTAEVDKNYKDYLEVAPVEGKENQFILTGKELKNGKKTYAYVTFTCKENGRKIRFSTTIKDAATK